MREIYCCSEGKMVHGLIQNFFTSVGQGGGGGGGGSCFVFPKFITYFYQVITLQYGNGPELGGVSFEEIV